MKMEPNLPNFPVGFGMWDKERINPAFEIGQTVTNETGFLITILQIFWMHFQVKMKFMQHHTKKVS